MAVSDTIQSIKTHLTNAYNTLETKGATIPTNKNVQNLSDTIDSIPSGGGSKFTGHYDAEGLAQIGWTSEEIQYYQDNGVQWNEENDELFELTESELAGDDSVNTRYLPKNSTRVKFNNYTNLIAIPFIDTSRTTSFSYNFSKCYPLTTIPQLDTSSGTNFNNMFYNCYSLKKIPQLDTSSGTNFGGMFYGCHSLKEIPEMSTSLGTNFSTMFNECRSLTAIPQLDTSSGTNFNAMFAGCSSLQEIPQLNTSSGTDFTSMFAGCSSLKEIPQLNTSSGTNFNNMFYGCSSLITIPQLNTGLNTNFNNMFDCCYRIYKVPELNASSCVSISSMFRYCYLLTHFGGLKNIGQAYLTTRSASYSSYKLDLSPCTLLTHDSLMNVINDLYDIGSAGVQPQQLVLGSTNLNKLTAEEKAIATSKGWLLS